MLDRFCSRFFSTQSALFVIDQTEKAKRVNLINLVVATAWFVLSQLHRFQTRICVDFSSLFRRQMSKRRVVIMEGPRGEWRGKLRSTNKEKMHNFWAFSFLLPES